MVMVGAQRVPYYQGGRAYQPYAARLLRRVRPDGLMFAGLLFGGLGGFDGIGDGIGAIGDGIGDIGDGIGDGIGDMFDGFDF